MRKRVLLILLAVESMVLVLAILIGHLLYVGEFKETELFREKSPDGGYGIRICEVGVPDFPFGSDHLKVTLYETIPDGEKLRAFYRASFTADVATDGAPAAYKVEWLEDGVQIALIGEEQPTAYYILPFKTLDD